MARYSFKRQVVRFDSFVDENQIICVGSRIKQSHLDYIKKHPVILPDKHQFSYLDAKYEHLTQLHAGPQATLPSLSEKYWPPGVLNFLLYFLLHDFAFATTIFHR